MKTILTLLLTMITGAAVLGMAPQEASAFCGFYVSGANQKMYNDATMVVMMREGTKTVLSMRNSYQGPPQDFAMVVPVPVVLQKENVKTLDDKLFERVDQLAAPRLVEYWEQDPCRRRRYKRKVKRSSRRAGSVDLASDTLDDFGSTVKIEAQFKVGEYDIVVVSATESTGLESWLKQNKYNIPKGAAEVLKPYVAKGQYFFVAKVDPQKVTFSKNKAVLSPLRFHYDSQEFSLPIRLGLLNAKGPQDLLVHILAKRQRYEVANYNNLPIPTNLIVKSSLRKRFGSFYTNLIDATLEANPKTVLTEYAWNAQSCDPCPTTPLQPGELQVLGADVINETNVSDQNLGKKRRMRRGGSGGWTLTRLHARYSKGEISEDLIFKKAPAMVGGRGMPQGKKGLMMDKTRSGANVYNNNFQGRYVILNRWRKKIACKSPQRGIWGRPPRGNFKPRAPQQNMISKRKLSPTKYIVRGAPSYLQKKRKRK